MSKVPRFDQEKLDELTGEEIVRWRHKLNKTRTRPSDKSPLTLPRLVNSRTVADLTHKKTLREHRSNHITVGLMTRSKVVMEKILQATLKQMREEQVVKVSHVPDQPALDTRDKSLTLTRAQSYKFFTKPLE